MNSVFSSHNRHIPMMPPDQPSVMVWIPVGQAVVINAHSALSAQVERDDSSQVAHLVLRIHLRNGSSLRADKPEDLAHLTTDAIVRSVECDKHGPSWVLVEIGDMVAYPHLRECAA